MKKFKNALIKRKNWIRQILVASVAAGVAWFVGDRIISNGGLVAAIVCALSIRVSLYKSVREGLGQIIGTAIGAGGERRPTAAGIYQSATGARS